MANDELAGLPEDVRLELQALADHVPPGDGSVAFHTITRRLLRLTRENAELKDPARVAAWEDQSRFFKERAERAEALYAQMLGVVQARGFASVTAAMSDLAAVRKRIAEADSGLVTQLITHLGSETYDTAMIEAHRVPFNSLEIGKRVRIL